MSEPEWVCHEPDAEWPCAKETGGRPGHHPNCGPSNQTFRFVLVGDHASDHLAPGDFYDIEEWRQFLAEHQFDIDDVYRVDRNDDGTMTIHTCVVIAADARSQTAWVNRPKQTR
jgi:hypothetical protein